MKRISLTMTLFVFFFSFASYAEEGGFVGQCVVAKYPPKTICRTDEKSKESLCVNTPYGGVSDDHVTLLGVVNLSTPIELFNITIQHEYTKSTFAISKFKKTDGDCWNIKVQKGDPICIDKSGKFSVFLPLDIHGPYSVVVNFSSSGGKKIIKQERLSRVVRPVYKKVEFNPELSDLKPVSASHVNAVVTLINDCKNCDFIGASTGGVLVTAKNVITGVNGDVKAIECKTDMEQGGQGRFRIGIPVGAGKNEIEISACNSADVDKGLCPVIKKVSFGSASSTSGNFEYISPPPKPIYSSDEFPTLPLKFKWNGLSKDEGAVISLNSDKSVEIYPDGQGIFSYDLKPQVGVNVLVVQPKSSKVKQETWVFGWGEVISPADKADNLSISLSSSLMEKFLLPSINKFLSSEDFKKILKGLGGLKLSESGGDKTKMDVSISDPPKVGKIKIENLKLLSDELSFSLNADDLSLYLDIGTKLSEPLPIFISFKKIVVDLVLKKSIENGVASYKIAGTPITPKNFLGDATAFGSFVICKAPQGRTLGSGMGRVCNDFNLLDDQTALVREKILDAFNSTIVDKGSMSITDLMNKGINLQNLNIAGISIPAKIFFKKGMSILPSGIVIGAGIGFDHDGTVIKDPKSNLTSDFSQKGDIRIEMIADLVNRAIYSLSQGEDGGPLWGLLNVDQTFFEKMGMDLIDKCDAKTSSEALCNIRPRVGGLLGTSLVTYHYFDDDKYPLQVRIRPMSALTPRISFAGERTIQIQLGGVQASFYALEVDKEMPKDKYGNWLLLFDGNNKPIVRKPQIVTIELNFILNIELTQIEQNPDDPATVRIGLKVLREGMKMLLRPIAGTNTTTVPDESLVSELNGKLGLALDAYADPSKIIWIKLEKNIVNKYLGPVLNQFGLGSFNIDLPHTEFKFSDERDGLILEPQYLFNDLIFAD